MQNSPLLAAHYTQVLGPGQDLELFFTNTNVINAYKGYITKILTRVNTITGVVYANDPIIFSLELANEPHTSDNYEILRGLPPGGIVKAWVYEISAFVRSLSPNHMVRKLLPPSLLLQRCHVHVTLTHLPCRSPPARRATA
jgi:endo-1,4-beta-mannosidase